MKLIIDIPEEIVKEMKTEDLISIEVIDNAIECIKNGTPFDSVIEDIKAEIAKIEIPKDVKTVDGSFAFCQALEIADLAIDRAVDKHISGKENNDRPNQI